MPHPKPFFPVDFNATANFYTIQNRGSRHEHVARRITEITNFELGELPPDTIEDDPVPM